MKSISIKLTFIATLLTSLLITTLSCASSEKNTAANAIAPQVFEIAKKNEYWKQAYITGKHAQVVFMTINTKTNPKNEIGMESHQFDQVIFVVQGRATAIINNKKSLVKEGDLIFIPQGTPHNFINLNGTKAFKIISIYSATDIPENSKYKTVTDVPKD